MKSCTEMVLNIGDTLTIGNRRLTLLDIEGELGLFQLDVDDQCIPLSSDEYYELLAISDEEPGLPR